MVQSGTIPGKGSGDTTCFAVPSAEGGFVGTTFYVRSLKSQEWGWDPERDYGFQICALDDAHVKVYDLQTQQLLNELTVEGGSGVAIMPPAPAIAVQSDRPITLSLIHNGSIEQTHPRAGHPGGIYGGYGRGVTFIGIRPNEDTPIYLPVDANIEAYFFASEDTEVTIDGVLRVIQADSYYVFPQPGTHIIRSDSDIVVQVNSWPLEPDNQGNRFSGALVPCAQTVSIVPDVTLTPLGGGFPIMYVVIGAAVAAIAVVAGFLIMRSRSKKAS